MSVQFKAIRSGRKWSVIFDLGSEEENCMAAVKYAWDHNARIIERVRT
jgi:hypothetical protein